RDVMTLVPRVLLSVTLAGPAPSGSTGTSRLCRGCSRPPRRFPGQAAPSFAALLRQGQRWKVSHLHSNRQRLTAHVDPGLVLQRYQEAQRRTWCSSSPVSPLPAWKFSSVVHLVPATLTSRPSGTGRGEQQR